MSAAMSTSSTHVFARASNCKSAVRLTNPAKVAYRGSQGHRQSRPTRSVISHAASSPIAMTETIQLASAKLPKATSVDAFTSGMYQWAATLTVSGQNMPFALPMKTDKTEKGFDIQFLRVVNGDICNIAKIESTVETIGQDNVLLVNFRAGENPFPDGRIPKKKTDQAMLEVLLDSLVDVPLIMNTMAVAIRSVAAASLTN